MLYMILHSEKHDRKLRHIYADDTLLACLPKGNHRSWSYNNEISENPNHFITKMFLVIQLKKDNTHFMFV